MISGSILDVFFKRPAIAAGFSNLTKMNLEEKKQKK